MAVKIRLSRVGKHKVPFYRIVVIDEKKSRDARPIEIIGTYDALNGGIVSFNNELYKKWVSVGAQISMSAKKICKLAIKAELK
jgi:small subunit ribosomal protein S16